MLGKTFINYAPVHLLLLIFQEENTPLNGEFNVGSLAMKSWTNQANHVKLRIWGKKEWVESIIWRIVLVSVRACVYVFVCDLYINVICKNRGFYDLLTPWFYTLIRAAPKIYIILVNSVSMLELPPLPINIFNIVNLIVLTNSMACKIRRFKAAFTMALQ